MSRYIVTTLMGDFSRSELWDDQRPMGIGHPFRWVLEKTETGIRLRQLNNQSGTIQKFEQRNLSPNATANLVLTPDFQIKIRPFLQEFKSTVAPTANHVDVNLEATCTPWFNQSLKYAAMTLGALCLMMTFWPKTQHVEQELIPEQFTKIVMTQTPVQDTKTAKASTGVTSESPSRTEKTQAAQPTQAAKDTAVAQAFRTKALQNAVSGLLKGGMTSLLAQSEFVSGQQNGSAARKMLDSKSGTLRAVAGVASNLGAQSVVVASIGNQGFGYKSGDGTGVSGQGKGYVKYTPVISTDSLGAEVQEGLTKDEVGEIIHRHLSEIRYCYESAMIHSPDIEGKLIVDFTIAGTGTVRSTAVKTSTLTDPRLDDCILRRLVTWKFPLPKGGIDVAVSYPFIFKTLGR